MMKRIPRQEFTNKLHKKQEAFVRQSADSKANIVSFPLKIRGYLLFEIWTTKGVMKKLLRNRGLVEGASLRKGRGLNCFISFP